MYMYSCQRNLAKSWGIACNGQASFPEGDKQYRSPFMSEETGVEYQTVKPQWLG